MIIYKVTNLVNGKIYIGQTTKTLQRRKSVHYGNARCGSDNVFHRSLMKYDQTDFSWSVVCKCNTLNELNEKEISFIDKFETLIPNGYNMTGGGYTSPMINPSKELIDKHQKNTHKAMQSFCGENNPMKRPEVIEKHKLAVNDPIHRENHSKWMKENYRHSESEKSRRCKHQLTIEKDGIEQSIINLKQWCNDNSYNYASFRQLLKSGSRSYKDISVLYYRYISDKSQPISPL